MKGRISFSVYLVTTKLHSLPYYVRRMMDNAKWLAEESDLILHKASALQELQKSGLPVPPLITDSN
jgi:hypothetical protein